MLALALGSVLLSVVLGAYWLNQIIQELGSHAKQRAALMIEVEDAFGDAGLELGSQVQEWKNSLLRIHDPVLYALHQQNLRLRHVVVQQELLRAEQATLKLGFDTADLKALRERHSHLLEAYQVALERLDLRYPWSFRDADEQVRGIDRLIQSDLRALREDMERRVTLQIASVGIGQAGTQQKQYYLLGLFGVLLPLLSFAAFIRVYRLLRKIAEGDVRARTILESIGDAVLVADMQGRVESINATAQSLLGWSDDEARGKLISEVFELYDVQHRQRVESPAESVLRDGRPIPMSNGMMLRRRDGSEVAVEDSAAPVRDEQGRSVGVVMVFHDVSKRYALLAELRAARAQFETLFEQMPEGVLLFDENLAVIIHNREAARLLEYSSEELLALRVPDIEAMDDMAAIAARKEKLQQTGRDDFESRYRTRSGRLMEVDVSVQIVQLPDGRIAFQTLFRDIGEQKQAALQIEYLAYHDHLTSLANRRLLQDRMERALSAAARRNSHVALLFIDLDHFKNINDTLGHEIGDRLLQAVAGRLSGCIRAEDTLARSGGDEFVIMLNDMHQSDDATTVAQKVIDSLVEVFCFDGLELNITPSIGISVYPQDSRNGEELLQHADVAMYHAKDCGRAAYRFYTEEINAEAFERVRIERLLHKALEKDEFELHYQPQIDLQDGRIIGCEALIRWNHPELGQMQPNVFIPIAEHSHMINKIGVWVMRAACRQAYVWQQAGHDLKVSFNVSARQFLHGDEMLENLRQAICDSGVDPSRLEIEMTESLLLNQHNVHEIFEQLDALGIRVALDDFGTGYSSLSYLRRFPISILKIDRSFVSDADQDADAAEMVKTIIGMAHNLRMTLVAEGVETAAQAAMLMAHGCEVGQGYHYSRPLPLAEFSRLLQHGIEY